MQYSLRRQTVHFGQTASAIRYLDDPLFFFCSFIFFDRSDKILTCLKTCLWNLGTHRRKIMRLSSAQFGLAKLP